MKQEFHNTNAKEIMDNSELCAQFLRKYSEVELLKGVRPEDIEDWTEKLRPFVGVEFEGDSVKKVRVRGDVENLFVVCLLEHKSEVDYDVAFQLLKYMVGIWNLHRNEANQKKKNASRRKGFRYPLIIPIVYYEGKEKWTAACHWKERVEFSEVFGQYVPDFTYKLIDLNTYSTKELLCTEEEISLVMLMNRIQTEKDLNFLEFSKEQREIMDRILRKAPESVLKIIKEVMYHFCLKLKLSDEETKNYLRSVEDRDMGELWAHMDDINIPKIRKEIQAERDEIQTERDEIQTEREEIQTEREEIQTEREEIQTEREEIQTEREEIRTEREEIRTEKEGLLSEKNQLVQERTLLIQEKEQLDQEKTRFDQEKARLVRRRKQIENLGEEKNAVRLICKKLAKGCSPAEIADALESDLDLIAEKIRFAEDFAPDYDFNKVYEAWQREV